MHQVVVPLAFVVVAIGAVLLAWRDISARHKPPRVPAIGERWIKRRAVMDPWQEPCRVTTEVLDVKAGWVRHSEFINGVPSENAVLKDQRTRMDVFRRLYVPPELDY